MIEALRILVQLGAPDHALRVCRSHADRLAPIATRWRALLPDLWRLGVTAEPFIVPRARARDPEYRATFPGFDQYCRSVPRILPRLTPAPNATGGTSGEFSMALYLKHREYNALLGAILLYLSLAYLRPAISFILHGRP